MTSAHRPVWVTRWLVLPLGLAAALLVACQNEGHVVVLVDEPGAEVWVDGVQAGAPGAEGFALAAGPHEVEVRAEGYHPWSQAVEVSGDRPVVLQVELVGLAGMLIVRSNVSGDTVWIDDKPVGPSGPKPHELPSGPHVVRVERPGYTPFVQEVELPADETVTIEASLVRIAGAPRGHTTETRTHVVPVPVPGYAPRRYHPHPRPPVGARPPRPPRPRFR